MKKTLIILPLFLFAVLSLSAQTSNEPILAMEVILQTIGSDTAADGTPLPPDSILSQAKMKIALTDTIGILRFYIKFGTIENSGNLMTRTFEYNAADVAYSRNGYDVQIVLGEYRNLRRHYSSLQAERIDNSLTPEVKFSR